MFTLLSLRYKLSLAKASGLSPYHGLLRNPTCHHIRFTVYIRLAVCYLSIICVSRNPPLCPFGATLPCPGSRDHQLSVDVGNISVLMGGVLGGEAPHSVLPVSRGCDASSVSLHEPASPQGEAEGGAERRMRWPRRLQLVLPELVLQGVLYFGYAPVEAVLIHELVVRAFLHQFAVL